MIERAISGAVRLRRSLSKPFWMWYEARQYRRFITAGCVPWTAGYDAFRTRAIRDALGNPEIRSVFAQSGSLPVQYGWRVDARICEIPWALSMLDGSHKAILDAGSSLNHSEVLDALLSENRTLTVATLGPEADAFWQRGVSYWYGDLRNLAFKDEHFDAVVCISTLEHIGMDNSRYAQGLAAQRSSTREFLDAVSDLRRVLRSGGLFLLTVPFGRYEDHGWFQQFDRDMLDEVVAAFEPKHHETTVFQYGSSGWFRSDMQRAAMCAFFDVHASTHHVAAPDGAAGERAVACLRMVKP